MPRVQVLFLSRHVRFELTVVCSSLVTKRCYQYCDFSVRVRHRTAVGYRHWLGASAVAAAALLCHHRAMPGTEDPTRTKPKIEPAPGEPLAASPAASPALQTTDDEVLTEESFRAILSSQQRAGLWEPADKIEVRTYFGQVVLDFTRAVLPPSGVIEINALAFCGEVRIIVPDGAEIEIEAKPVLGSIEQHERKTGVGERIRQWITGERDEDLPAPPPPAEPHYFHIDGRAIMGAIKVMGR